MEKSMLYSIVFFQAAITYRSKLESDFELIVTFTNLEEAVSRMEEIAKNKGFRKIDKIDDTSWFQHESGGDGGKRLKILDYQSGEIGDYYREGFDENWWNDESNLYEY